jgi:hypothetical protein
MSWGWQPYPVTRLRPALVDDGHGNLRPDFTDVDPVPVGSWKWAPSATGEDDRSNREHGVRFTGQLIREGDADVLPGDWVEFDLGRFRLVGAPQRWRPGTVLDVERWDG